MLLAAAMAWARAHDARWMLLEVAEDNTLARASLWRAGV